MYLWGPGFSGDLDPRGLEHVDSITLYTTRIEKLPRGTFTSFTNLTGSYTTNMSRRWESLIT